MRSGSQAKSTRKRIYGMLAASKNKGAVTRGHVVAADASLGTILSARSATLSKHSPTGVSPMSDQLLVGAAPSAPEGQEMLFYCADSWLALYEAIDTLVEEGFPPYQRMSGDAAATLSVILTKARSSGRLRATL